MPHAASQRGHVEIRTLHDCTWQWMPPLLYRIGDRREGDYADRIDCNRAAAQRSVYRFHADAVAIIGGGPQVRCRFDQTESGITDWAARESDLDPAA